MTAPLVPAHVDLNGYEFMPLYGHKLFGSEFDGKVSDRAWRAAVTLWWKAWNQVPAASLPNDDKTIAKWADFGDDVKAFRKLKDEILHGFILCDDGRLYHRKLAGWALEAWERRVKDRERKQKWRDKRRDGDVPETGTGGVTAGGTETGPPPGPDSPVPSEAKRSEAKQCLNPAVASPPLSSPVDNSPQRHGRNGRTAGDKSPRVKSENQWWKDAAEVRKVGAKHSVFQRPQEAWNDFLDRVFHAVKYPPKVEAGHPQAHA